ncbi:transposase, partial [Corynebacterium macginleyi]
MNYSACRSPHQNPWNHGPDSSKTLKARGLSDVYLVTSDAHLGIQAAVGQVLPTAGWQRCRTHCAKNLSSKVSKRQWTTLSGMFHSIFQQTDAQATWD